MGPRCFSNSGVEKIGIPRGVEEIPCYAFSSCRWLKEVTFEEDSKLRTIEKHAFWGCNDLAKADLPDGLKSIGPFAFYCSANLRSVIFPNKLERIGAECFSFSGLESLVLPESAKEIDAQAFQNCKKLKDVQ